MGLQRQSGTDVLTVAPIKTIAGGEPSVSGEGALAIGVRGSTEAQATDSIAVGNNVTVTNQRSVAIGRNVSAQNDNQVVIGTYLSSGSDKPDTNARGINATVIGQGNEEYGPDFGGYANVMVGDNNTIGDGTNPGSTGWNTLIGHSNTIQDSISQGIVVGADNTVGGDDGIVIGVGGTAASGEFVVSFGGNQMKLDSSGNLTINGSLTENGDASTTL